MGPSDICLAVGCQAATCQQSAAPPRPPRYHFLARLPFPVPTRNFLLSTPTFLTNPHFYNINPALNSRAPPSRDTLLTTQHPKKKCHSHSPHRTPVHIWAFICPSPPRLAPPPDSTPSAPSCEEKKTRRPRLRPTQSTKVSHLQLVDFRPSSQRHLRPKQTRQHPPLDTHQGAVYVSARPQLRPPTQPQQAAFLSHSGKIL